jgi:DNA ligase-1
MTEMQNILKCLSDIYNTSGRKDKETLLSKFKDNDNMKRLLINSMSSSIVIGISEKTFEKVIGKNEMYYKPIDEKALWDSDVYVTDIDYNHFIKCCEFIDEQNKLEKPTASNEVISRLIGLFNNISPIERYWYYRMFIGNLNIGVGPKSVNKIFGPIIEQYTPMLADSGIEKFDKWAFDNNQQEYYVDTKIDGLRLTIFFKPDTISVKTRAGKTFYPLEVYFKENLLDDPYLQHTIKALHPIFKNECNDDELGFAIDCEVLDKDGTWESTISLVNVDDDSVTYYDDMSCEELPKFILKCFDLVNLSPFKPENFNKQVTTLPYYRRRELLDNFIDNIYSSYCCWNFFSKTHLEKVNTLEEVQMVAQRYIDAGYEGAVVKHPTHQYICDRKNVWLKIKDIQTFDGIITDVLPGEASGKYNSMASKLLVKVNMKGQEIIGTIGTGFKDEDRKYLWDNKNEVIGKVVEFTVLSKTVNDNFRSGVFKGLRVDKVTNDNA